MKLLFITQKIDQDDDVLGVYHRWAEELANRFDRLEVICLYRGKVRLPSNARIHSLGKESNPSRLKYIFNFYKYIWRLRNDYDKVFVHMNPEYMILGGWFWKMTGKKTIFWYAHYLSNIKLRLASLFADKIVTSTRLAYPLKSKKLVVLQQGIDTDRFKPSKLTNSQTHKLKILYLGRIAPVKNIDILLKALSFIKASRNFDFNLDIVGGATSGKTKENNYLEEIKKLVIELGLSDTVNFLPPVPNHQTPEIYNSHDLFINLTDTGSFDKTTLEAMSCELPVLVSNGAFSEIFPADLAGSQMFREKDPVDLAKKIQNFISLPGEKQESIGKEMRHLIVEKHSLAGLSEKLYKLIRELN